MREDELIAQLRAQIERSPRSCALRNAIGDDTALWQPSRSHHSAITSDALVEGRHFERATMSLHDIGWRAMAANLSDLAAVGARPVLATVALGVPSDFTAGNAGELYGGMLALADRHGCAIAGGDVVGSPVLFVSITAIGEVRPSNVKGRGGARAGDVLAVTGALGASRAGLHELQRPALSGELRAQALRAHGAPEPRVAQGRALAASANVHAMMDLSDGLSTDLARLCAASGCGALIESVPVAASARAMAAARGEEPDAYALAGGEDFELLLSIDARAFGHVNLRFSKRFGAPLLPIGRVREGSGVFARKGESEVPQPATGWESLA